MGGSPSVGLIGLTYTVHLWLEGRVTALRKLTANKQSMGVNKPRLQGQSQSRHSAA